MTAPSLPSGYDETRRVQAGQSDCHITVGFDRQQLHIPRFLIQLHYQTSTNPVQWKAIARMDHNETSVAGHDVYQEGLHVDVHQYSSSTVHLQIPHAPLPSNPGIVIRGCDKYFRREADYFVEVYEERRPPGSPPSWRPDGGESTPMFNRVNIVGDDMSQESSVEDALTPEELSEHLAEATGTTPEEIERAAEEMEIAPPWEATVVDE